MSLGTTMRHFYDARRSMAHTPFLWRTRPSYGAPFPLGVHSAHGVSAVAGSSQEFFADQVIEHDPARDLAQSEQTSCFAQGEPFAERLLERPKDD